MAIKNPLKSIFVKKVMEMYGFSQTDARFLYEILIDSLIECFKLSKDIRIPRVGKLGFKLYGKKFRVREGYFKPYPEMVYKVSGRDYREYVDKRKLGNPEGKKS